MSDIEVVDLTGADPQGGPDPQPKADYNPLACKTLTVETDDSGTISLWLNEPGKESQVLTFTEDHAASLPVGFWQFINGLRAVIANMEATK